eukprot:12825486-Prorocentrum_lima.AAC.1
MLCRHWRDTRGILPTLTNIEPMLINQTSTLTTSKPFINTSNTCRFVPLETDQHWYAVPRSQDCY